MTRPLLTVSMPAATPPFRTVSLPREQDLRKQEVRIRDAALPIHSSDPAVANHVNILFVLEDAIAMHETAEKAHRSAGRQFKAEIHRSKAADLLQIKFHPLAQLAQLLI